MGAAPHKALAVVLLVVHDVTAAADDPHLAVHCNGVEIPYFKTSPSLLRDRELFRDFNSRQSVTRE